MIKMEDPVASPKPRRNLAHALLVSARPKQWIKNLLVFAAPIAAGSISHLGVLGPSIVAFFAFTFTASGIYLLNDVLDVERDRSHPRKTNRPIASGEVGIHLALAVATFSAVAGLALSFLFATFALGMVVVVYLVINLAYSNFLKHEPVLDILVVAIGFLLRAIAGGVADHVPLSDWFLIVTGFSSLFVVVGKRHAEVQLLGSEASNHRASLGKYPIEFLNYARTLSSGVAITAYCLWAFEKGTASPRGSLWVESSILFFVAAILRYALLVEQGHGGAPEDVIISDRLLQVIGAIWIGVLLTGIYLSR